MIINKTYSLPENNYNKFETIKKQIVVGHTSTMNMSHFSKWLNRLNGCYKKTAPYSIDVHGNIYEHFDPIYYTDYFSNNHLNKRSILILLENEGWLTKDPEKNVFLNWIGHIYSKPDVIEKRWRGYLYWSQYTTEQINSLLWLINKLCDEFVIPKNIVPHNVKIDDIDDYEGVLYKSNLEKYYTDLSPAWDFLSFKNKFEIT